MENTPLVWHGGEWEYDESCDCPRCSDYRDTQRREERPKHERFTNPAICEGCGYPLTNHPRMGCAFLEGLWNYHPAAP